MAIINSDLGYYLNEGEARFFFWVSALDTQKTDDPRRLQFSGVQG